MSESQNETPEDWRQTPIPRLHVLSLQKDGAFDESLIKNSGPLLHFTPSSKALIATIVGNALEWYDFALFGFLAPELSELFFPPIEPAIALLSTFAVFGGVS